MSSTTSPALPAFSYAQAAKGLAPSSSAPHHPANASATPSVSSSRDRQSSSAESVKPELTSKTTSSQNDETTPTSTGKSTDAVCENSLTTNDTLKENIQPHKPTVSASEETKVIESGTSSPSFGAASSSTLSKEEDISISPNETSENWDKQSQVSTSVEKSTQTTGGGKVPDTEEDWEKEPVFKTQGEKELKAAPIPPVNFWQARKEAQEAKAKAVSAQRPAQAASRGKDHPANVVDTQKVGEDESRRRQSGKASTRPEKENGAVKRKQGDTPKQRDDGRRQQTRTAGSNSQVADALEHSIPPPVGDAESWPTPETAISDERKKPMTQERSEKPESKNATTKPHSTKWVPVPYVPSTKFITPLPLAATRRGGRPAIRGGPETGEQGASTSQPNTPGSKTEPAASMGPPPLPKKVTDQERGRNQESSGGSRANSVPTQSRRAASSGAASAGQRNFSATFGKERTGFNGKHALPDPPALSDMSSKNDSTSKPSGPRSDSKPQPVPTDSSTGSMPRRGSLEASRPAGASGDAHTHPRYDVSTRRSIPANFYTNSDIFGSQDQVGMEKSKETPRSRDYSKDKPETSREKVASWRDREVSYDKDSREFRPDRSRGSYRGRGGPPTYGQHPTTTHPSTAPLPQQPFASSGKSNSYHNGHRQNTNPYSGPSSQSNQRSNVRSQSIPTNTMYSPMSNPHPSVPQPLSPIHTDMPMYTYQQPMHAGFMSAVPYNSALDSYALLAMVHGQLEYYFSIDNLCKDMFLRNNMDSQGFVLLSVIAQFKRIKALTEDMDVIRHVCTQLRNIEYRPGEDGVDRVRRKDGWEQWIRPMSERVPSAQNEGPPPVARPSFRKQGSNEQHRYNGPLFTAQALRPGGTWNNDMYHEGFTNGQDSELHPNSATFNPHISETPINTTALTPSSENLLPLPSENGHATSESPVAEDSNEKQAGANSGDLGANGYSQSADVKHEGNVFPDEKIAELKVIVLENDVTSPLSRPPFVTAGMRTFSHGSIDGQAMSSEHQAHISPNNSISGLRGGSGSAEQLELGGAQPSSHPGDVASVTYQDGNMPVFWNKDGAQLIESAQEDVAWEPYDLLHDRALEQRLYGDTSATMESLYKFWSHFLVRNFNARMYDEFHLLALEDASQGFNSGINHLIRYYEALLSGQTPLTERHASDLVQLVQNETDLSRPAFQKLRTAWRNGAFNLKSRKRVDTIITPKLRAELES